MPHHLQVTACLHGGGPVSKLCTCPHCTLAVCSVCGAYEGGLTTDCPGTKVDFDKQKEVYETTLNYTDDRGWHLAERTELRSPRFAKTALPPIPPPTDPRTIIAPSIDWSRVDRLMTLQHNLTLKAIAWVLADREGEERSIALARTEDEAAPLRGKPALDQSERELFARLERHQIDFRMSDQLAQKRDDEFRQAAKKLVAALEEHQYGESTAAGARLGCAVVPVASQP